MPPGATCYAAVLRAHADAAADIRRIRSALLLFASSRHYLLMFFRCRWPLRHDIMPLRDTPGHTYTMLAMPRVYCALLFSLLLPMPLRKVIYASAIDTASRLMKPPYYAFSDTPLLLFAYA